ncbi:Nudix hydrolase 20, chloroplastic [Trichoplax sp. H2]|nr:Nudix hydrolase 20, chloroplastic [Trichoplax sp. H2]|eukprot:RDD44191.1 Nudix hydrolase 20, chloroplastic [Trichoplax sp. H2]
MALESSTRPSSKPFTLDGQCIGRIPPYVLQQLHHHKNVFQLEMDDSENITRITLHDRLKSFDERTKAVDEVMKDWRDNHVFPVLEGWRNENDDVLMWVGKRSKTKATFPGKLDNLAAGGISVGYNIADTLIKECAEEASLPEELARRAISTGALTYCYEDERGYFPETQFVYDLELPPDFTPVNSDGEVEEFYLMKLEEVVQRISDDEFKPNSALSVIDFLIRRGYLKPDDQNYLHILSVLHRDLD